MRRQNENINRNKKSRKNRRAKQSFEKYFDNVEIEANFYILSEARITNLIYIKSQQLILNKINI